MSLKLRILLILKSLLPTLTVILKLTTDEDYKQNCTTNVMTSLFQVNLSFISSNIQFHQLYSYVILELVPSIVIFWTAQLLTKKLLRQGYVAPSLKSSLQKFYGRHHNLVDHYEISISQMTMDLLLFTQMFLSSITTKSSPLVFWWGPCCSLCCSTMCLCVLSFVLCCLLRFPLKNDVRFVFTPSYLQEG